MQRSRTEPCRPGVGASLLRKEDDRHMRGRAQSDVALLDVHELTSLRVRGA
jgi:hypothetical protein